MFFMHLILQILRFVLTKYITMNGKEKQRRHVILTSLVVVDIYIYIYMK